MSDTLSWGWYSSALWPGYSSGSADNLTETGNGLSVDPDSYVEMTLHDNDGDGFIWDHDTDDVQAADPADNFVIETLTLRAMEIARYANSTMVVDGVTYSGLDIEVTLFTNGSYSARLLDSSIPVGANYANVDSITLGTWDGVEYDGITVSHIDDAFVCFAEGTRLITEDGPRPIETLGPGDRLTTLDGTSAPICWIGCRMTEATGKAAPIRFGKGTLGNTRPLFLSPHHRVLLHHPALEDLTGHRAGLVAAKHLCGLHPDIRPAPREMIRYWHVLTPRHEMIMAESAWTETLYPGSQAWKMLGPACQKLIHAALPQLQSLPESYGPMAFPEIAGHHRRKLGAALLPARGMERLCA